jgi:hypothetical protein
MSAMARSEGGVPQVAAGSTAPAASPPPADRFAAPLPAGPAVQPTDAAPVTVSDAS